MSFEVKKSGNFVTIIPDGSSDWDSKNLFPAGMQLKSILFYPSGPEDVLIIREATVDGPVIISIKDIYGTGSIFYLNGITYKPYINVAECFFTDYSNVIITYNCN